MEFPNSDPYALIVILKGLTHCYFIPSYQFFAWIQTYSISNQNNQQKQHKDLS